jgi:hypothetical protein
MNNLLESQVTDLAYLAESPIVLSTSMNDQRQSSSAGAESPPDTGSGKKRKAEETNGTNGNGTTHTRAKRNRYISIAWYVQDNPQKFWETVGIQDMNRWIDGASIGLPSLSEASNVDSS